ncbi:unnamed protein product [Caenorhabditis brenneri]
MAHRHNHVNEKKKWEKERAENAKTIAELKRTVQRLTDDAAVIQQKMTGLNQFFEAVVTSYSTQSTKLEEMTSKKEAYKKMVKHMRIDSDAKNRLCLKLSNLAETLCNGTPAEHQIGHQMLELFLESADFAEYVEKQLDAAENAETPPENPQLLINLRQLLAAIRENQNKPPDQEMSPETVEKHVEIVQKAQKLVEDGSNPWSLSEICLKLKAECEKSAENGSNSAPEALSAENAMILAENALKSLYLGLKSTPEAENPSKSAENGFKLSQGGQGAFKPYSKGSGAHNAQKSLKNGSKSAPKAPKAVNAIILAENLSKLAENRSKSTPEPQNGSNAPKPFKNAPNPPAAAQNPSNLAPGTPKLAPETPEIKKAQKTTQNSAKSVVNAPKWFQEAGIQSNLAWEVYEAELAQKSPKPAKNPSKSAQNAPNPPKSVENGSKSVTEASGAQNPSNLAPGAPKAAPDAKNAPKSVPDAKNPSKLAPDAPKPAPEAPAAKNAPKTAKKAPKPVFAHELGNDVLYASQEALMAGLEDIIQQNQAPRTQRAPTPPPDLVLDDDFDEVKKNPILAEFGLGYMKDVVHPTGEDLKRLMNTLMQVSGIQSAVEREKKAKAAQSCSRPAPTLRNPTRTAENVRKMFGIPPEQSTSSSKSDPKMENPPKSAPEPKKSVEPAPEPSASARALSRREKDIELLRFFNEKRLEAIAAREAAGLPPRPPPKDAPWEKLLAENPGPSCFSHSTATAPNGSDPSKRRKMRPTMARNPLDAILDNPGPTRSAQKAPGTSRGSPGPSGPSGSVRRPSGPSGLVPGLSGPSRASPGPSGPLGSAPGPSGPSRAAPGPLGASGSATGPSGPSGSAQRALGPSEAAPGPSGPSKTAQGPSGPAPGPSEPSESAQNPPKPLKFGLDPIEAYVISQNSNCAFNLPLESAITVQKMVETIENGRKPSPNPEILKGFDKIKRELFTLLGTHENEWQLEKTAKKTLILVKNPQKSGENEQNFTRLAQNSTVLTQKTPKWGQNSQKVDGYDLKEEQGEKGVKMRTMDSFSATLALKDARERIENRVYAKAEFMKKPPCHQHSGATPAVPDWLLAAHDAQKALNPVTTEQEKPLIYKANKEQTTRILQELEKEAIQKATENVVEAFNGLGNSGNAPSAPRNIDEWEKAHKDQLAAIDPKKFTNDKDNQKLFDACFGKFYKNGASTSAAKAPRALGLGSSTTYSEHKEEEVKKPPGTK